MSRPVPTLNEVITLLEGHCTLLNRQIAALREGYCEIEVVLLVQYVSLSSQKRTAEWADAQGFTRPGVKGGIRRYTSKDIAALIARPPDGTDPGLMILVRNVHKKGSAGVIFAFA